MIIVFGILALILAIIAGVVLLTFAFAWYEHANRDPRLVENRFSARGLGLATRLVLQETVVLIFTVALHPFGWFGAASNPAQSSDETPVILLHGLFQNRMCWLLTRLRLQRRGFGSVHTLNLPPWKDVESLTERLAKKVDELRHGTGGAKVHLVGHSMGGIIARNYVQVRGGAAKVDRLVLLGAPNTGSRMAPFALSPLGKLLVPGSEFLRRLEQAELPESVAVTAVFTRHENMVLPFDNARLEGVRNVELAGMGHTSLLFHRRAFESVLEGLTGETP